MILRYLARHRFKRDFLRKSINRLPVLNTSTKVIKNKYIMFKFIIN